MFSADLGGITASSTPPSNDPPFQKVALLLHGDGTNGAQNNTFVDGSSNNFTITRTGNVAQGTFSPFSLAEGQWSNYFNGTTDYLQLSNKLNVGSGNFTFECWYYKTYNNPSFSGGAIFTINGTSTGGWNAGSGTGIVIGPGQTQYGTSESTISYSSSNILNTWTHLAVVRSSGTLTVYVNGTSVGTGTDTSNYDASASGFPMLGCFDKYAGTARYLFYGYISNARVVNNAVYTSNFTPPTSALTAVSGTSLLTCQSNRFIDKSSNNFTITLSGDTKVTAFSPFAPSAAYSASTNGGSAYFDGSGDYLSAADNANLRFGTSAFTIQALVYRNAAGTAHSIVSKGGASTGFTLGITSTNILRFTDTTTNIDTTTTIPAGTWTHVAAVRTNTSTNGFQLYINGVSSKTATVSTNFNQTDTLYVGADRGAANVMNGYITDLRYVNGTAETITVPTAPLTAVTNTQLLLNCTNAGIIDNAGKNDIETVGNAQVSTSVKKYGTGSMYFDGTGDWLVIPASTELTLNADFTIEFWVNLAATTDMMALSNSGGTQQLFRFNYSTANTVSVYVGAFWFNKKSSVPSGTWTHVALTRSGSTAYLFIDGVSKGTYTGTGVSTTLNIERVGVFGSGGSYPFNGYIDDLRITKGQALYTSNFIPPTQAFPNV